MSISQNYPIVSPSLNLDFANTKTLDPRITFSRPTGAVYYDGKSVTKAEENLVLYSQEFDNGAWTKSAVTVTENASTAPDGTTTADKVIPSASAFQHYVGQNVSGATGTLSVFAKADGYNTVTLFFTTHNSYVTFDLSTGSVVETVGSITGSIVDLGGGQYRLIGLTTLTTHTSVRIFVINGSGYADREVAGDGTSGVFLWGAQAEQRSTVTAYTPTTTQPITNYIPTLLTAPADTARFDHDPVTGESLGLLVEEQRTNLLLRSEEFDNSSWDKSLVTVIANQIIAPDGTLTGDTLNALSGSGVAPNLSQSVTVTNGLTYTGSVYVKKGSVNFVKLRFGAIAFASYSTSPIFNLNTGTLVSGSGTITPVGNDLYRITATATASASGTGAFAIDLPDANGVWNVGSSYTGYETIYIWGAQLE